MSERDVQDSLKFMREKLRKERKAQNMSQLTLSAEADLACNTICRIEKGTAEPGIGNLLRLTDALHIPMSELFPQGEGPKAKEIGIIDDAKTTSSRLAVRPHGGRQARCPGRTVELSIQRSGTPRVHGRERRGRAPLRRRP